VFVYDPVAEHEARKLLKGVVFAPSALEAVDGADAVVLVTEWPEFGDLDFAVLAERMRGSLLVDGRNFFEPAAVREAGLTYEGIGRAQRVAAAAPAAAAGPAVGTDAGAHPGGR
jgi:UDPglucose 6-dehydrogenase